MGRYWLTLALLVGVLGGLPAQHRAVYRVEYTLTLTLSGERILRTRPFRRRSKAVAFLNRLYASGVAETLTLREPHRVTRFTPGKPPLPREEPHPD